VNGVTKGNAMRAELVERDMLTPRLQVPRALRSNERAQAREERRPPRVSTARIPAWFVGVTFALLGLGQASLTHAATYKWVDEKGVVHYSDSIPPEAVDRGNVQLNKQGVPIKKTDPAPTAEQRKAMQDEAERQKALAKEREITDRRDRALRDSYTSEDEIELSKTRALATIENQLQSAQAYVGSLTKRRAILSEKKASGGDKLPVAEERELEGIDAELAKQEGLIVQKKKEQDTVTAKYDADKQRWREMRSREDAARAAAAAAASAAAKSGNPAPASAPQPPQKSARPATNPPPAVAGGTK